VTRAPKCNALRWCSAYLDTKKPRALLAKLREERARKRAQEDAQTKEAPFGDR